jgi:hypothetical protein
MLPAAAVKGQRDRPGQGDAIVIGDPVRPAAPMKD